jgi:hypothetical protein
MNESRWKEGLEDSSSTSLGARGAKGFRHLSDMSVCSLDTKLSNFRHFTLALGIQTRT